MCLPPGHSNCNALSNDPIKTEKNLTLLELPLNGKHGHSDPAHKGIPTPLLGRHMRQTARCEQAAFQTRTHTHSPFAKFRHVVSNPND